MKTNEQIQLALSVCKRNSCSKSCPYHGEKACYVKLHAEAAILIRQLERERDAAVADLKSVVASNYYSGRYCRYCKYNEPDGQCHHRCIPYSSEWGWEWRGAQEVE